MSLAIASRQGGSSANNCADDDAGPDDDYLCSGFTSGTVFGVLGGILGLVGVALLNMNNSSGSMIVNKSVRVVIFLTFTFLFLAYMCGRSGLANSLNNNNDDDDVDGSYK